MTNTPLPSKKILEDAINIFAKVNSKINGLIDCSVKDFVILNSNFKKYYNNLQKISAASQDFLNFLLETNNNDSFNEFLKTENFSIEDLNLSIKSYLDYLKKNNKELNYILLNISNLKQDLSTIRLLFTNLRFDPLVTADHQKINEQINNLSHCSEEQEKHIHLLCNKLTETIKFAEEGIFSGIEVLGDQLNKSAEGLNYFNSIYSLALKHNKQIAELDSKRLLSTSEIITNLQFQDILRQKIEHVQNAHQEISENLVSSLKEEGSMDAIELFKIRDISTLQSAQLIHANQEYQSAVEKILNKISELNIFLNNYSHIWNHFCKIETAKIQAVFSKLGEQLPLLTNQAFSLHHISEKLDSMIVEINKELEKFSGVSSHDKVACNNLEELKELFHKIEQQNTNDQEYSPVSQINSELKKFESGYNKNTKALMQFKESFRKDNLVPKNELLPKIEKYSAFAKNLTIFYKESLLGKANKLANSLSLDTIDDFTLEQVAYYKTFEKEVKEIIILLDDLLIEINVSKKDINKERLEHLKKLYTMDSERDVHNMVTKQKVKPEKKDTNENEVEFF